MASSADKRTESEIEHLLDEAFAAMREGDWQTVGDRAGVVLTLEPTNADAQRLADGADRARESRTSAEQPAATGEGSTDQQQGVPTPLPQANPSPSSNPWRRLRRAAGRTAVRLAVPALVVVFTFAGVDRTGIFNADGPLGGTGLVDGDGFLVRAGLAGDDRLIWQLPILGDRLRTSDGVAATGFIDFEAAPEFLGEPAGPLYESTIGSTGGTIDVPDDDLLLAGVRIKVPPGAVATGTSFSVQAEARPAFSSAQDLASTEPALLVAFTEAFTASAPPGTVHPYSVFELLEEATFAGPTLRLGPAGSQFARPVSVTIPLSLLGDVDATTLVPALRGSDGRWEIVSDFHINEAAGTATVNVRHFSELTLFQQIDGVLDTGWQWVVNRTGRLASLVVDREVYERNYAQARATLPTDTFDRFVEAAGCVREQINTSLPAVLLPKLGLYLAAVGYGDWYRSGQETALDNWIRARNFEIFSKDGWRAPNSVMLADFFGQALYLTGGDVFWALVTAHNVLRDSRGAAFLDLTLQNYRGDGRDESGARYHLFGTALYSLAFERMQTYPYQGVFDPGTAVGVEEAIISNGYFTDMKEVAVDFQGIELGRRLYHDLSGALSTSDRSDCVHVELTAKPSSVTVGEPTKLKARVVRGLGELEFRWPDAVSDAQRVWVPADNKVNLELDEATATVSWDQPGIYKLEVEVVSGGQGEAGQALVASDLVKIVVTAGATVPTATPESPESDAEPDPTITKVTPDQLAPGVVTTITVRGEHFREQMEIYFYSHNAERDPDLTVLGWSLVNSTELTIDVSVPPSTQFPDTLATGGTNSTRQYQLSIVPAKGWCSYTSGPCASIIFIWPIE